MLAREVIRRVREIQIRTGRQVADVLAGQYVSVFRGRGLEFDEVRPYTPGDDVRTIDWNVTARMGQPFVKRFVEERQLTLMLMADVSASQQFGSASRSKREATAELCALLAFSATRNDDKVGLILFHDAIEHYIPPRKGQKHSLRVVREVLAHGEHRDRYRREPGGAALPVSPTPAANVDEGPGTNIAGALEFLMSMRSRKSVCFVVSDFFDDGYMRALRAARGKHDVIAVLVTDPRECELPACGLLQVRDAETGRQEVWDTNAASVRSAFAQRAAQRIAELRESFAASKIDFIHVDASQSVVEPVVRFFRMRERRHR